jgi:hypothetical protein
VVDVVVVESAKPIVRLASWFLVESGLTLEVVHAIDAAAVAAIGAKVLVLNTRLELDARRRLFAAMRDHEPRIRILDLSPAGGGPDSSADAGADAHLRPPFVANDLVDHVRDLLASPDG